MPEKDFTLYKPEYCKQVIEFFDREPYREIMKTEVREDGSEVEIPTGKLVPNDLPFIKDFAKHIGVSLSTIYKWTGIKSRAAEQPDFVEAYEVAKELRKPMLITNSLRGLYNAGTAIFCMKNWFGWKDKQEVDTNISGNIKVEIVKFADSKTAK